MKNSVKVNAILTAALAGVILTGFGIQTVSNKQDAAEYVNLGSYNDIELSSVRDEITEELVQETIKQTVNKAGGNYVEAAEGAVSEAGDMVTFDYYPVNKPEDTESLDYQIGEHIEPHEFEELLTGAKIGEEKSTTLSNGNDIVVYAVKLTSIRKPSYDVSDEFVAGLGIENVSTKAELEASIKEYLNEEYDKLYKDSVKKELRTKILDNAAKVDEPSEELETAFYEITHESIHAMADYLTENGTETTEEDVIKSYMDKSQYEGDEDEYLHDDALKKARACLVFNKIAEKEHITMSDSEFYFLLADKFKGATGNDHTLVELKEHIDELGEENLKMVVMEDKVLNELAKKYAVNTTVTSTATAGDSAENAANEVSAEASVEASVEASDI